jgi:hypothetical protein
MLVFEDKSGTSLILEGGKIFMEDKPEKPFQTSIIHKLNR